MIRASVESRRSRVTATSSAPRPLIVPANTSSPAVFSIGSDSPVTGAWFTWLSPASTRPSSGTFLTGPHQNRVTDPHVVHRYAVVLAVAPDDRLDRCQIHQRPDGAAGAIHRATLEHLREREQEHD